MNSSWRRYFKEMAYYLSYIPLGLVISLIPFLLNLGEYHRRGEVVSGLMASFQFGLIVGSIIWLMFATVFAALTFIHVRTGWPWRVPWYLYLSVASLGMLLGVWLALRLSGQRAWGVDFLGSIIFGGIVTLIFLLHFAYRQAKEEALSHRATAAEARYNALEHQMRPHFLFNALNSLAELIESGHEQAAEMTHKLSDLYRLILANSNSKTSTIKSEIEIVRRYLDLEQLRLGGRLSFSIDAPSSVEEIHIPSLMMQTLVENSVKHGIAKSIEGGAIRVEVCKAEDGLYQLRVANTGRPFTENSNKGAGLANTRARLELLYGDRHQFKIGSDNEGRTVAGFYFTGERIA